MLYYAAPNSFSTDDREERNAIKYDIESGARIGIIKMMQELYSLYHKVSSTNNIPLPVVAEQSRNCPAARGA